MDVIKDFNKYATGHLGITSLDLHRFTSVTNNSYISPTII